MFKRDELAKTAEALLAPGERLLGFTMGSVGESPFETLVILSTTHLRLTSATGTQEFEISAVKEMSWSSLWARLNITLRSPKKKVVVAIYGGEWKDEAKRLSQQAAGLLAGTQ